MCRIILKGEYVKLIFEEKIYQEKTIIEKIT